MCVWCWAASYFVREVCRRRISTRSAVLSASFVFLTSIQPPQSSSRTLAVTAVLVALFLFLSSRWPPQYCFFKAFFRPRIRGLDRRRAWRRRRYPRLGAPSGLYFIFFGFIFLDDSAEPQVSPNWLIYIYIYIYIQYIYVYILYILLSHLVLQFSTMFYFLFTIA